jgi:hypothetical protein
MTGNGLSPTPASNLEVTAALNHFLHIPAKHDQRSAWRNWQVPRSSHLSKPVNADSG